MNQPKFPDLKSSNILSIEEIHQKYPNQWVLIVNMDLDENLHITRGEVIAHSEDRDEIYGQLPLRNGKPATIEYTGSIPDDIAVLI